MGNLFATLLTVVILIPQTSLGQVYTPHPNLTPDNTTPQAYHAPSGYKYGTIPNVGSPTGSGSTADISIAPISLDDSTKNSLLGCAGYDLHQGMLTTMDIDDTGAGGLDEYFDTPMANYMLTTLYNSPSVAALYDSLESFGSSRTKFIQDRCTAINSQPAGSPLADALKECIRENVAGNINDPRTLAQAYKFCLLSPNYTAVAAAGANETVNKTLQASLKEVTEATKWSGTFFSQLKNSAFCTVTNEDGSNTSKEDCSLMSYIPNFRWCVTTENDNRTCQGTNIPRVSAASITPKQVFNMSFATTNDIVNYGLEFAKQLMEDLGVGRALGIAVAGENIQEALVQNNTLLAVNDLDGEFKEFTNCSRADLGEDFKYYFDRLGIDLATIVPDASAYPDRTFNAADIVLGNITASASNIYNPQGNTEFQSTGKYEGGVGLIMLSTYCVIQHEMRVSLADYIQLAQIPSQAQGVVMAIRTRIAYRATENLLRFVKHKLEMAEAEFSYAPAGDPRAPAPHTMKALRTSIEAMNNKIAALRNVNKDQVSFSQLMANIEKSTNTDKASTLK